MGHLLGSAARAGSGRISHGPVRMRGQLPKVPGLDNPVFITL